MKVLLLFTSFLITAISSAQEKKDTKIIVIAKDTINIYNRIGMALFQEGFVIKQQNQEMGIIATDEKALKSGPSASLKIRVLIKDSTLTFFGEVAENLTVSIGGVRTEKTFIPIKNLGMKGSTMRRAWDEMTAFAKQFGSDISYSK
jgi:hypothetical protein